MIFCIAASSAASALSRAAACSLLSVFSSVAFSV